MQWASSSKLNQPTNSYHDLPHHLSPPNNIFNWVRTKRKYIFLNGATNGNQIPISSRSHFELSKMIIKYAWNRQVSTKSHTCHTSMQRNHILLVNIPYKEIIINQIISPSIAWRYWNNFVAKTNGTFVSTEDGNMAITLKLGLIKLSL